MSDATSYHDHVALYSIEGDALDDTQSVRKQVKRCRGEKAAHEHGHGHAHGFNKKRHFRCHFIVVGGR